MPIYVSAKSGSNLGQCKPWGEIVKRLNTELVLRAIVLSSSKEKW